MNSQLIVVDFLVQFVGWIISVVFHTERFFDLTGSSTFLLLIYLSRKKSRRTLRQNLQSSCVSLWALRLGTFLFYRILLTGKDSRFDQMRRSPMKLFAVWIIQGIWVIITLLPTLYLNEKQRDQPLNRMDYLGWTLWLVGFLIEVIADGQKMAFRHDPNNEGKFISTGLWKYSRHPNYFGEICMWIGLYLSAAHLLNFYERVISAVSPVFVTVLLCFISGIPLLEKQAMEKFGHDSAYRVYRRETPILIPFVNFPRI